MRVNRRFLYWGIFLVAFGGVLVLADLDLVDETVIANALRLWPVVLIAIGLAIVVRRTRYSLAAWLIAAALPGLAFGGAIAAGPRLTLDCIDGDRPALVSQQGTFAGPADITVSGSCGSLAIRTEPGSAWRLEPGEAGIATASVTSSPTGLSIDAGTTGRWNGGSSSRRAWQLSLPASTLGDVRVEVDAGDGSINLAGVHAANVSLSANAADVRADLTESSMSTLTARASLGAMSIHLPSGSDLTASLKVSLGQLSVCVPGDLGLRVHEGTSLGAVKYEGFEKHEGTWETPGYALAPHHADVTLDVSLGSIEFNPIGGCK